MTNNVSLMFTTSGNITAMVSDEDGIPFLVLWIDRLVTHPTYNKAIEVSGDVGDIVEDYDRDELPYKYQDHDDEEDDDSRWDEE